VTARAAPAATRCGRHEHCAGSPALTLAIRCWAPLCAPMRAARSLPWRVSIMKSVMRSSGARDPIWRRYGLPGGAKRSPANDQAEAAATGRARASRGDRRVYPAPSVARGDAGRAPAGDGAAGRFQHVAFRAFADESEGARLRLASRIAAGTGSRSGGRARARRHGAGATRLFRELPFKAGSTPTLIPTDVAARHSVSVADFDAPARESGVLAACAGTAKFGARRAG